MSRMARPLGGGPRLILALALTALSTSPSLAVSAVDRPIFRGRPLVEVLRHLQERGLNVIFSTAVVDEGFLVTIEPTTTQPRRILEEILTPLGLEARDGPGGTLLIVRGHGPPEAGVLNGRVISAAGDAPIAGASVSIPAVEARGRTDGDGRFEIREVPAGPHDVIVEAPGFVSLTVPAVQVGRLTPPGLHVKLQPRRSYLEEIIVTPGQLSVVQEEQAASRTMNDAEIVSVPAFGGDVSRVVELLPGVASADNSAAFNVRGSRAEDVSYVLDGLELYDPFHLRGFRNPFSLVDTSLVERLDFYAGPFTADFGDRHGGVVKLSTRPDPDRAGTSIGVGTINTRVSHTGSLPGRGGSWLASARTWYPQAFGNPIDLGEPSLDPRFEDLYLNMSFRLSPRSALSAHGLLARDTLDFEEPDGSEAVEATGRSGYFWLRLFRSGASGLVSDSVLSAGRLERRRKGLAEPVNDLFVVQDDREVDFFGLKHDISWEISENHLLKAGADLRRLEARYDYTSGLADDPASQTSFQSDPSGTSFAAYVAHRVALTERFATEVGLRWDRQTYTNENQVSPRLNALWRIGDSSELRLGLGQYFQSQRIHELRIEDGETRFLPAELSRQAGLTFKTRFPGVRFQFDAYYRNLARVRPRHENIFNPIDLFPEIEPDRVLIAADHARLRGFELLLRDDSDGRFTWWTSYAWSSAEDVIRGNGVPRAWDQRHAGRFLVGYRLRDRWILALAGTAHTGWPTTPVSGRVVALPNGTTELEPIFGRLNSDRLPAYVRFDLKASRSFKVPGGSVRLDLEVRNATNRENVCCVNDFILTERPNGSVDVEREVESWRGVTPTFRLVWEF